MNNTANLNIGEGSFLESLIQAGEKKILHGRFKLEIFEYCNFYFNPPTLIDVIEFDNQITNTGGALLLDLLAGAGGTAYNNANSYIGVGDSSTAVSAAHTDLQAATNKLRKAMDAAFPSRSSQVMTYKSTFGTTDANYAWNEIGLFNNSSAGTMLCRQLVTSPFTKTSALSIVASYTLTCP